MTRQEAAEEVCWTLAIAMQLGLFKPRSREVRDFLAAPLLEWFASLDDVAHE